MRMNSTLLAALAALASVASLAIVGCAAPSSDDAASSSAAVVQGTGRDAVRVDAAWRWANNGDTPTIGDPAEAPVLGISVTVDDESVRADGHAGFDGMERPFALVPHADGSSERVELAFQGSGVDGYIQLYPVDHYASTGPIWLTEADLAVVKQQGITVGLDTNVGTIESDKYEVSEKNP